MADKSYPKPKTLFEGREAFLMLGEPAMFWLYQNGWLPASRLGGIGQFDFSYRLCGIQNI